MDNQTPARVSVLMCRKTSSEKLCLEGRCTGVFFFCRRGLERMVDRLCAERWTQEGNAWYTKAAVFFLRLAGMVSKGGR